MKKIIPLMLVGLSMAVVPAVSANPVDLSGDVSIKYERDTADGANTVSGTMTTFKLKAEKKLTPNWSLYARLGAQHATAPQLADYNTDGGYKADDKWVVALDQFGVVYTADKMTYKLGRQDVTVGATALLYSRPDSNVGNHNFVDGLTVSGKAGVLDLSLVAAKEDNPTDQEENKIYAIRTGYSPAENLNLGLTLGRYEDHDQGSTNHWAIDEAYTFGKNTLTAEYTKSNRVNDNQAYAAVWDYAFNDKTAVHVTFFRVEANGDMGGQSDFDNDNRGIYYGITHQLTSADSLELVYKDQKTISSGEKNTKLEFTVTHTF